MEPLRDSTAGFERGKAVVILLASSLKARLCVRTFVVCWLVSTVGRKDGRLTKMSCSSLDLRKRFFQTVCFNDRIDDSAES